MLNCGFGSLWSKCLYAIQIFIFVALAFEEIIDCI